VAKLFIFRVEPINILSYINNEVFFTKKKIENNQVFFSHTNNRYTENSLCVVYSSDWLGAFQLKPVKCGILSQIRLSFSILTSQCLIPTTHILLIFTLKKVITSSTWSCLQQNITLFSYYNDDDTIVCIYPMKTRQNLLILG
jgi:hypothetical protein